MGYKFFSIFILSLLIINFSFSLEITKITVSGNTKTKSYVLINELRLKLPTKIKKSELAERVSLIRNTNLFSKVSHRVKNKTLEVKVKERWTTIPILKFSNGGGVSQLTLGVYDPNVLGHYIETGLQYERLGSTNSGVAWFKNPRLIGTTMGLDTQFWYTNRIRTLFVQNEIKPEISTGYLQTSQKLFTELNYEFIKSKIKTQFFYQYLSDQFSSDLVSDEVKQILTVAGLPPKTQFHHIGLGLEYGRIYYDNQLVDGQLIFIKTSAALSADSMVNSFVQVDMGLNYYRTIDRKFTFAQRILLGLNSTDLIHYKYYAGGLDRVRGFSDNRFSGRALALSNSELRYAFLEHPWVVLQAVGFADYISTSEKASALFQSNAVGVGLGLRFFLPKVYRFVLRFDYAVPLIKDDDLNFSFGVQQFF